MAANFIAPQHTTAWQQLAKLPTTAHLRDTLQDPARHNAMQLSAAGISLDFSRQRVDMQTLSVLHQLAQERHVMAQAHSMAQGAPINATEDRAVLHMALRGAGQANPTWGDAISLQVRAELNKFLTFADTVYRGEALGHTGLPITDVVNVGIGGSDLGPRMAVQALAGNAGKLVRMHFVSNPDAWALHHTLSTLDASRTLVVVLSKTFTTQETLTLATSAREWLVDSGISETDIGQHLAAVSAATDKTSAFGVPPERVFGFWDWVGGRYSVWSAIGLPLAMAIGSDNFLSFLAGAHEMDQHFLHAPAQHNLPLTMALLGVWNRNFLGAPTQLIAPYAWRLEKFTAFVQQMDMESNGKSTHTNGEPVAVATGPIVWGGLGIDGQHAYFQLIHQGQHLVPVDFIGVRTEDTPGPRAAEHHRVTLLNLNAQAHALACGRDDMATAQSLRDAGMGQADITRLTPHRSFAGNVPSNVLWLDALTPNTLGALVALYEHKVFCQAAMWGTHAYDQWGVELGKTMAKSMEQRAQA
ncbi:MAG: glucose-6-phosphate isomerase [Burkholderiaceae bacterium]